MMKGLFLEQPFFIFYVLIFLCAVVKKRLPRNLRGSLFLAFKISLLQNIHFMIILCAFELCVHALNG